MASASGAAVAPIISWGSIGMCCMAFVRGGGDALRRRRCEAGERGGFEVVGLNMVRKPWHALQLQL